MKPMLATATDGTNLNYPLLASPKLDGIRCLIKDGVAVSRSLKPIPNKHVQHLFGRPEFNGLDGELIVGEVAAPNVFQATTSGVMSIEGEPDVFFYVFDDYSCPTLKFKSRLLSVAGRVKKLRVIPVGHTIVENEEELLNCEASYLAQGFEGLMVRDPDGQYKHGRSTLRQSWLLKLKRFEDSEAMIMGSKELMHNSNEAKINVLGHQERSHQKAGLQGKNMLGALSVKDIKTGVTFDLGTGFTEVQRKEFWVNRKQLLGKLIKYKYQPVGVKEKPRFPVFLGFRAKHDL